MRGTLEERFWAKVDRRSAKECWPWRAATQVHGYGVIGVGAASEGVRLAHRVSWEIANRRPPVGEVRHSCDNPPCVNPAHLSEGEHGDNMRDMSARGRQWAQVHPEKVRRGEANNKAKLDEAAVRVIRESERPTNELAARFGVNRHTIARVRGGRSWGHIG